MIKKIIDTLFRAKQDGKTELEQLEDLLKETRKQADEYRAEMHKELGKYEEFTPKFLCYRKKEMECADIEFIIQDKINKLY